MSGSDKSDMFNWIEVSAGEIPWKIIWWIEWLNCADIL
jgi:hypothetical protein